MGQEIDADEWIFEWRGVLCRAGLGQSVAAAASLEVYGRNASKADLTGCPWCDAGRWLASRSLISAGVIEGNPSTHDSKRRDCR